MNHSEQPAEAEIPSSRGIFYWPPFWLAIFLVLAVSTVSYAVFSHYSSDIRQEELNRLTVIADVKVTEFLKWKRERMEDANVFSHSPFFVRAMEKWLQLGAPHDDDRQMLIEQMRLTQSAYGYQEVFLFDAQGKLVLSPTPDASPIGAHIQELVKQAIQTQAVLFLDIGSNNDPGGMGMAIPFLVDHGSKSKTVGAAYLGIDTSGFLFPSMKAAPSDYKSTELVLVRREGNDVLFMNIPAADKGGGLLRKPLSQPKLPSAMAILGNQTGIEGIDYRGVPVFAATRKIPDFDWFIVVKVAREDVYAPLRRQAWLVSAAIAFLMALTGLAVGMWWRSQRAQSIIAGQKRIANNLLATSAYTRSLIEASLDSFVTINPEGMITDVNKSTEKITGFSRSELIGTDFSDYFTEPDKAREGYRRVFNQSYVTDYPLALRHRDGHATDVLYNASVYRNEAGKVLGVFASARDITGRKQAEEALRNSENRYRLLVESAPMCIHEIGMDGRISSMNRAGLVMMGVEQECKVQGFLYLDAVCDADRERIGELLAKAYAGEADYFEFKANGPGELILKSCFVPIKNQNGSVEKLMGITEDITERKKAEMERERYYRFFNTSTDLMGIADLNGAFKKVNPAFVKTLGYSEDEIVAKPFIEFVHTDDRRRTLDEVAQQFKSGYSANFKNRYVCKDGSLRWLSWHASFNHDEGLTYATARDITESKLTEDALREKEERLALATVNNGVGIWDWNLQTQEMIWDDSMYALYHIRREDFSGTEEAWRAALYPDDLARGDKEVGDAIAGKKPFETEFRVLWPNGEIRYIKAVAKVFRDNQGIPLRMLGINMDISDRKKAEMELRGLNNDFVTLLENTGDFIYFKDQESRIRFCSQTLANITGHTSWRDMIGKHDQEVFPKDTARIYYEEELPIFREGKPLLNKVDPYFDEQGRPGWVNTSKLPVFGDDGKTVVGIFGISRDITERKRAEDILQVRLRLLEFAGSHSMDELLTATLDEIEALTGSAIGFYHFVESDQKKLSLQSWSTNTLKNMCTAEGKGSHYDINLAGVWVDCVHERRPVIHNDYASLPHRKGMPEGHAPVIREIVVPVFRGDQVKAIIGVGNKSTNYDEADIQIVSQLGDLSWDITERKRAEEDLRKYRENLEELVLERTDKLETANKELESFSYSVSHDLRTPLRAIDGFSRILLDDYADKLDDEGKRLLNVVRESTSQMGQLINDILKFSRTSRLEMTFSEIDMEGLAHEVVEQLQPVDGKLQVEIEAIPPATGDRAMMRQVFINLLSNAIKFSRFRDAAMIKVGGSIEGDEAVYFVQDNGAGFDMQYADKLFGVFQRLHGVSEFEGTGIGLAIVKRIITRHGGRVWAEGKVNEGATIYFALPAEQS